MVMRSPSERQELLRQARATLCRRRRTLQPRHNPGIVTDIILHEVEVRPDDLQDVVEVVRHAPGELARGLHLLALPQGRLVPQLLGYIDASHHRATTRHLAARYLVFTPLLRNTRGQRPVRRLDLKVQWFEQGSHCRQAAREQLLPRQGAALDRIPVCELHKGFVPGHDRAFGVDHADRIAQALEGRLEQTRTCKKVTLRAFESPSSAHDDDDAGDEAHESTTHDQQRSDVAFVLLRVQRRKPPGQQQPLTFDERVADAANPLQRRARRAGAGQGKRGLSPMDPIDGHTTGKPLQLFTD